MPAPLAEVAVNQPATPPKQKPPSPGTSAAALTPNDVLSSPPLADTVVRARQLLPANQQEQQQRPVRRRNNPYEVVSDRAPRAFAAPAAAVRVRVGPTVVLVAFGVRAEWRALRELALPPLGTYVVVSGDGGRDVGTVVDYGVADGDHCDPTWQSRFPPWRVPFAAPPKPHYVPSAKVVRLATAEEARGATELCLMSFHFLRRFVQHIVDDLAAHTDDSDLALVRIMDVETQFNRRKITVYFASAVPLRISPIVQRLFLYFKCRVWMLQVRLDGSRISTTPNAAAA